MSLSLSMLVYVLVPVPVPMSLSLSMLVLVPVHVLASVPASVAVCLSDGCFQNVCELDIMYVALQRVACGIAVCCAR